MLPFSSHDIRFLLTVAESLNPLSYHGLKHRNLIENLTYLASLVFLCLAISTILALPLGIESRIAGGIGNFESLSLDYKLSEDAKSSGSIFGIKFLGFNDDSSLVSVSDEGIERRSILCAGFRMLCGPSAYISREQLADRESLADAAWAIFLLMLPGLFLLAMAFHIARFVLIISIAALAACVFARLLKYELNLYSSFAVCSYASTVLVVPGLLAPGMNIDTLGLEWPLFGGLLIAALLWSTERRKEKHGRGRGSEDKHTDKGAAQAPHS